MLALVVTVLHTVDRFFDNLVMNPPVIATASRVLLVAVTLWRKPMLTFTRLIVGNFPLLLCLEHICRKFVGYHDIDCWGNFGGTLSEGQKSRKRTQDWRWNEGRNDLVKIRGNNLRTAHSYSLIKIHVGNKSRRIGFRLKQRKNLRNRRNISDKNGRTSTFCD
jgi:hypothetical protein